MENNKIAALIASKNNVEDKFEIWMKHYDILQSNGRIYSRNNNNEEVEKIYCNCSNCITDTGNVKYQKVFHARFNKSFDDLKNTVNNTDSYAKKLKIWIRRFGINYSTTYELNGEEVSIAPTSPSEIAEYNRMQYDLWKEYYFKSIGKNRYSQTDLNSRVERLNKQLESSPFTEIILENTKTDLIHHYAHAANDETKSFFQNLIYGISKSYDDKIWELSELINYIDAREAYLFLCYLHKNDTVIKDAFSSHTAPLESRIEQIAEVKGLLTNYPAAETSYNTGIQKLEDGVYDRNAIDDLRLSLELLLKAILENGKSLENQQPIFKSYLKTKKVAPALANLLWDHIDNIAKYNNDHVKHNDAVTKIDMEMVVDLTTTVIKQIVKISQD